MILHGVNLHLNNHVGGGPIVPIIGGPTTFIHDEFAYTGTLSGQTSSPVAGPGTWSLGNTAGGATNDDYKATTADTGYAYSEVLAGLSQAIQSIAPYDGGDDYTVRCVAQFDSIGTNSFGPCARVFTAGSSCSLWWAQVRTQGPTLELFSYSNGTATLENSTNYTPPVDTDVIIDIINTSADVTFTIDDGTTQLSIAKTSTLHNTATLAGIMQFNNNIPENKCFDFKVLV